MEEHGGTVSTVVGLAVGTCWMLGTELSLMGAQDVVSAAAVSMVVAVPRRLVLNPLS